MVELLPGQDMQPPPSLWARQCCFPLSFLIINISHILAVTQNSVLQFCAADAVCFLRRLTHPVLQCPPSSRTWLFLFFAGLWIQRRKKGTIYFQLLSSFQSQLWGLLHSPCPQSPTICTAVAWGLAGTCFLRSLSLFCLVGKQLWEKHEHESDFSSQRWFPSFRKWQKPLHQNHLNSSSWRVGLS